MAIVLAHSHPSGYLAPSQCDIDTTDAMIQCGELLRLQVVDHVIISEDSYFSFVDAGLIDQLKTSEKFVPLYRLNARKPAVPAK